MKEYDILLFDVKDFSKQSDFHQLEIRKDLFNCIGTFFKISGREFHSVSTGDGYYICLVSEKQNHIILLDLISSLISEIEDIEMKFALHTGELEVIPEFGGKETLAGGSFTELNRFISSVKSGNTILISREFYEKFISGEVITNKVLSPTKELIIYQRLSIQDKHGKKHEVFNVAYIKKGVEYGFEFSDDSINTITVDDINFEDFRKIIEYSFGRKKAQILKKVELSNPYISYCFLEINISKYTKEYFLFIKNHSIKTRTLDHFLQNNKLIEPLTICANRKYLDEKRNTFWATDLLEKLERKSPDKKKVSFSYFDDFLWENCIPDTLKSPNLFDEERNFINPEYIVSPEKHLKSKTHIEDYLLNFIKDDISPIALLKGSGGMGKTTLLKRIADLLSSNTQYQKFVFYLDGQNFAKYLYKNIDYQIEKIETLSDLLRFYFATITTVGSASYSEVPLLLSNELSNIIISSGKIIIMVDGLDEISGSLKESFSLNTFISDIININKILNHSKILISSRDYYWDKVLSLVDNSLIEKFRIITLKGFDESMAEEYFEKKFGDDKRKKSKALSILKSLTRNTNTYYWPFLVYLVSDIVEKEQGVNRELSLAQTDTYSKYLDPTIEFDYIIINFCLREKQRQNIDLEVDDFIELFKEIIIAYEGEIGLDNFREYVLTLLPVVANSDNGYEGYKNLLINPLLKEKNSKVLMSIDFIQYHLTAAFLAYFILNTIHSTQIYRLLSRYYDGKEDLLKEIQLRLIKNNVSLDIVKLYMSKILILLRKNDLPPQEKVLIQKSISTLLYLSFRIFESRISQGINERTALLKELYDNDLDNLHIYGDFYTFDFSGETIRNSTFNYYTNFFKSTRDDKTKLLDSKVEVSHSDYVLSAGSSWNERNFDKSCIISSNLKIILRRIKAHRISDFISLKKDITSLLARFQKSGRWIQQSQSHLDFATSSKLNSSQLIHELQSFNILFKGPDNHTHNWHIVDKSKESVNQLLNNNHIDSTFEKIFDSLYSRYYS